MTQDLRHEHTSFARHHWTEIPLRRHLVREHDRDHAALASKPLDWLLADHLTVHPEVLGFDRG